MVDVAGRHPPHAGTYLELGWTRGGDLCLHAGCVDHLGRIDRHHLTRRQPDPAVAQVVGTTEERDPPRTLEHLEGGVVVGDDLGSGRPLAEVLVR